MDEPEFVPTPEAIQEAAKAAFSDPSTLARTMIYALNHLQEDAEKHPEDQMMAEAEMNDVLWLRSKIVAALAGVNPEELTAETANPAFSWMLDTGENEPEFD